MGGDHSTSQQFNRLKLSEWQVLEESNHLRVLVNRKNMKETIEEHPISFSDQKNLEIAQNNDSELVSTTHFNVQKQQEMCSKSYSGNLYTQHIPIRLSNIVHVPFPDILHLYNQSFNGFQRLSRRLGPFKINEDCIGVNLNHIAKVWHSSNFSQNQPHAKVESQYELVRNIVSVIEQNTDTSSMPRQQPLFSQFLYRQNQKVGFAEAKRKLELYANYFNQGVIPTHLSCVERAGGAFEIRNKWNQKNILDQKNSVVFARQVFNNHQPLTENTMVVLPVQASQSFTTNVQRVQRVQPERGWDRYDNFAPKARSRIQYPQNVLFSPPPVINNNRPNLVLSSRVNQVEPPRISQGSGINAINHRILSPQPSISTLSRPINYQQYNNFSPPPPPQFINLPRQANFQKHNQFTQPVLVSNQSQQPPKNILANNLSERKLNPTNLAQNNVVPIRSPTQVAVIQQPLRVNKVAGQNNNQNNIQQKQILSNSSLPSAPVNTQVSIPQQKPPSQTTIISNHNVVVAPQIPQPGKAVSSSQSNILNSSQNQIEYQSQKNKTTNQIFSREVNQTGVQNSSISINNQSINGILPTNIDNSPAKPVELASSKQLKLSTGQQPWMKETLSWQYQQNFEIQKPLSPSKQGYPKENVLISPQKKVDFNQQNRYSPNIINSQKKIDNNSEFFVQKHFNLHEANSASSKYNAEEQFYSPQRTLNAMTKNINSIDVNSAARSSFQANPQPNQSISQIVTKQNNYIDQNVFSSAKQEQSINTTTKNYTYGYDWNNYNAGDYSTYKYNIEKQIGGYNSFNYNSYDYQVDSGYGKQTAEFTKAQNKVENGGYTFNEYYSGKYDGSNYNEQIYIPKYSYESRQEYLKYDNGQLTSGYKITQKDTNEDYERTTEDLVSGKKATETNKLTGLTSNHFDNNLDLKQSVIEEESYNVQWDPQILADLQANIHHN